jgi:hypothetical protein
MGKYDPLFEYLCRANDGRLEMTFSDIEQLVGPLPASASVRAPWWANEAEGGRHVQARAWLNAGREVESVDRATQRVVSSAATWRRGS